MAEIDMEKLDQYMARNKINSENLAWHDPRQGGFKVEGLYWFAREKRYHRFPEAAAGKVPDAVMTLAGCTAGGQIRFCTDSCRIVLSVRNTSNKVSAKMAETGRSGFDLYCGKPGSEVYWNCGLPVPGELDWVDEVFSVKDKEMREFRLNFPLYNGVESLFIGLEKDAKILPPTPLIDERPIVIYGTSITQGGCASRPGSAFTNRLSRMMQREFFNFGFSGNGRNQAEVAHIVAQVENPAMIIIDSEANSVSAEKVLERVPVFLDILRAKHPEVPIVIVTKVPYGPRYALEIPILKAEFKMIYEARVKAGDKNIYFIDGSDFWDEDFTENTIDSAHPTDLGFAIMAKKLAPQLAAILK
jgi:lysophospholipase L1-like esterase